jgi:hypothetical protein
MSKASPRLTPYRLKEKKSACRLKSPYHLKDYGSILYLHVAIIKRPLDYITFTVHQYVEKGTNAIIHLHECLVLKLYHSNI